MDNFYDIIIVGAGPAGCTAALYAHKHGLKPLVIDKKEFPRDKICGDALMPLYKEIFKELAIDTSRLNKELSNTSFKADVYCNDDFITIPVDILLSPRKTFDDFLFNETSLRVSILQQTEVKKIVFNADSNNVTINENGVNKEVTCKYVIGADGASSAVRRLCNVQKPAEYAVASRSYYVSDNIKTDLLIKYTDEIAPGYHWQFKVAHNIINTGVILFDSNKQAELSYLHKKYTEELNQTGNEIDKIKTWQLPFMGNTDELAGAGYILIGDAGGFIDPLFGHGIDTGMLSGRLAAYAVFKNYDNRQKVSDEYKTLVQRKIYHKWNKNYDFCHNISSYIKQGNTCFFNKFTEHLQQGYIDYSL